MPVQSRSQLITLANTITNAVKQGFNTPARVGGFLRDVIDNFLLAAEPYTTHRELLASELTNETIDFSASASVTLTLDTDITELTLTAPTLTAVQSCAIKLVIQQDGTGGHTIGGYSSNVLFTGGVAPTLSSGADEIDAIAGWAYTDGTILCVSSLEFATP